MDRIKCLLKFDSVLLLVSHYNSQPSAIAWSYTHMVCKTNALIKWTGHCFKCLNYQYGKYSLDYCPMSDSVFSPTNDY